VLCAKSVLRTCRKGSSSLQLWKLSVVTQVLCRSFCNSTKPVARLRGSLSRQNFVESWLRRDNKARSKRYCSSEFMMLNYPQKKTRSQRKVLWGWLVNDESTTTARRSGCRQLNCWSGVMSATSVNSSHVTRGPISNPQPPQSKQNGEAEDYVAKKERSQCSKLAGCSVNARAPSLQEVGVSARSKPQTRGLHRTACIHTRIEKDRKSATRCSAQHHRSRPVKERGGGARRRARNARL